MNGVMRFFTLGAADADKRVARALAPRPLDGANRYLHSSMIGRHLDRATMLLESWWQASVVGRTAMDIAGDWRRQPWPSRYAALGSVLLIAVATHLIVTLAQGPRPGWFWLLIPAMVLVFGALLLAASRSTDPTR